MTKTFSPLAALLAVVVGNALWATTLVMPALT